MLVFRVLSRRMRRPTYVCYYLALSALLAALLLVSCSNPFGSSQASPTATALPANLPLAQLKWCGKPTMLFRDEGAAPTATATATATATTSPTATSVVSPTATTTASSSPTIGTGKPT